MEEQNVIVGSRRAISNVLIKFRTLIDPDKKVYMIQQVLFGLFKMGVFQALPKLDYVLVAKSYFQPACQACRLDEDEKMYYQVSLVYNGNRRIITHETKRVEEAFQLAEDLKLKLKLRMKDASVRGKAIWTS